MAVARAGETWRIPVAAVAAYQADPDAWADAMLAATLSMTSGESVE
jgi:hypothetical protein